MLTVGRECYLSHPFHSKLESYHLAFQSSSMSRIEVRKEDIKVDINMTMSIYKDQLSLVEKDEE